MVKAHLPLAIRFPGMKLRPARRESYLSNFSGSVGKNREKTPNYQWAAVDNAFCSMKSSANDSDPDWTKQSGRNSALPD